MRGILLPGILMGGSGAYHYLVFWWEGLGHIITWYLGGRVWGILLPGILLEVSSWYLAVRVWGILPGILLGGSGAYH